MDNQKKRRSGDRRSSGMGFTIDAVLTKGDKRTSAENRKKRSNRKSSTAGINSSDGATGITRKASTENRTSKLTPTPTSERYSLGFPPRVGADELRLPAKRSRVFGVSLDDHLAAWAPRQISIVIETCVCAIYDKGIHIESILRIPGTHNDVQLLRKLFDRGEKFDILKFDIHAIASALKQYLRELPDPLIPAAFFQTYLQAMVLQRPREKLENVKKILRDLPPLNRLNLCYLIHFLHDISTCELRNKMNPKALGVCMGSNLLSPPKAPNRSFGDSVGEVVLFGARNSGVEYLIVHCERLFPNYVVTPKSLTSSPGSLYMSSRSQSAAPRFAEIRNFFRTRINNFFHEGRVQRQITTLPLEGPVKESQFDLRQHGKRRSSSLIDAGAENISHRSCDSAPESPSRKSARNSLSDVSFSRQSGPTSPSSARTSGPSFGAPFVAVEEEGALCRSPSGI